jgi:hypothetical protein
MHIVARERSSATKILQNLWIESLWRAEDRIAPENLGDRIWAASLEERISGEDSGERSPDDGKESVSEKKRR